MTILQAIDDWADAMEKVGKAAKAISKITAVIAEQTQGLAIPKTLTVEDKNEATKTKISSYKKEFEQQSEVTIEMIRTVLAEKSQNGLTPKVKELLNSYGAEKLSALKPEDYKAVYAAAKELS